MELFTESFRAVTKLGTHWWFYGTFSTHHHDEWYSRLQTRWEYSMQYVFFPTRGFPSRPEISFRYPRSFPRISFTKACSPVNSWHFSLAFPKKWTRNLGVTRSNTGVIYIYIYYQPKHSTTGKMVQKSHSQLPNPPFGYIYIYKSPVNNGVIYHINWLLNHQQY